MEVGGRQWDRSYGTTSSFSVEVVRVIRRASDQGYVFGAYVGGRSWLFKVDSQGDKEWDHYLGSGNNLGNPHIVGIDALEQTTDSGYILTGSFDYPHACATAVRLRMGRAGRRSSKLILSRAG